MTRPVPYLCQVQIPCQKSNTNVRGQGQLCERFDIVTHECFDIVASFLVCDKTSTISWSSLNTNVRGQGQLCEHFDIVASFLVCDKTSTISRSSSNTKVRGQIPRSEVKVKMFLI